MRRPLAPPATTSRADAGPAARAWLPYLLLAGAVACWAGNFVVARAMRDVLPPVSLNMWRWLIALVILLPFAAGEVVRHRELVRRHAPLLLALGATGVAAFHTFVYLALSHTTVMSAVLLGSTIPVLIPLLSWAIFRDRLTPLQGVGLGVSLLGALTVIVRGDPRAVLTLQLDAGALWMAAAVPMWALYSVLLKAVPRAMPPLTLLTTTTVAGLLLLLPVYAWRLADGERLPLTLGSAAAVLYIGVFAAVVAFLFWNRGVAMVGPNRAGLFIHLMPVFGAGLSFAFLGETLASYHLAGAALVVVGLVMAARGGATRRTAAA
jgi:drug/metabolite transporter (DMT)-like permease